MERKLTAILSADVEGYSRLMGEDEEATVRTLNTYRDAMSRLIEEHTAAASPAGASLSDSCPPRNWFGKNQWNIGSVED